MLFTHFLKTRCKLKWRCFFSASLALSMKTKMKRLTRLWLLAFVGHKTRLAWDVPLSLKTRRSEHRNISLLKKKNRNESTWIKALCFSDFFYRTQIHTRHFHKAFAYHQSIQVLFQYVPLEGSSYSKVVLVAEQLVYELLKQWTACHPCYSSCVFSCIKNTLEIKLCSLFPFFSTRTDLQMYHHRSEPKAW